MCDPCVIETLEAEIARLAEAVEAAYREGLKYGCENYVTDCDDDFKAAWLASNARKAIHHTPEQGETR